MLVMMISFQSSSYRDNARNLSDAVVAPKIAETPQALKTGDCKVVAAVFAAIRPNELLRAAKARVGIWSSVETQVPPVTGAGSSVATPKQLYAINPQV